MGLNSRYEIRVKGILDGRWTAWFEDLQVTGDGDETVISGPVADQAVLHGVLTKWEAPLIRRGSSGCLG